MRGNGYVLIAKQENGRLIDVDVFRDAGWLFDCHLVVTSGVLMCKMQTQRKSKRNGKI